MNKFFLSLFSLLAVAFAAVHLSAQSPRFYSVSQGLPSSRIIRLSFDTDQFLWIATERGLCRFNGLDFTNYTSNRNSQYSLHENNLNCILEDAHGEHWVGAMDGFYNFSSTENKFTYHELSLIEGDRVSVSDIKQIPGNDNQLLVSSFGRGVYVFDTQRDALDTLATSRITSLIERYSHVSRIKFDTRQQLWCIMDRGLMVCDLPALSQVNLEGSAGMLDRIASITFNCMEEDSERQLMYAGSIEGHIYCVDERTMQVEELPMQERVMVHSLQLTDDNKLLVGTENNGLYVYDLEHHTMQQKYFNNCPIDLSKCKVHDMEYDSQGNLWLGLFQRGLLVIPSGDPNITYRAASTEENRSNLGCVSCFSEQPGQVAIVGLDGAGLLLRNKEGRTLHLDKSNSVLETNSVLGFAPDGQGGTYVGTFSGGIYHLDNCADAMQRGTFPRFTAIDELSIFKSSRAMALAYDQHKDNLYIGTNGAGVYRYSPKTGQLSQFDISIFNKWILSLYIDKQRHLWVGTQNGLGFIDLEHNVIRMIPGSMSLRIYNMTECGGHLWFATDQDLMTYDEVNDTMLHIERPGQHEGEEMTAITSSADSMLWMTSTSGLFSYDVKREQFHSYNCEEVRLVGNYDYGSVIMWSDGRICFGGDNGLIYFMPERMNQLGIGQQMELYFTHLWINNAPVNYSPGVDDNRLDAALWHASQLTLQPDDGAFRVAFSVREYNNPRGLIYEYRLKGHDSDWQRLLGGAQSAYYRGLPGGDYTLQVRAYRDEADLDNGNFAYRELGVTVLKPWYLSWWMKVLYVLLFAAIAWSVYNHLRQRAHERRVLHRTEQKRRINEEKLRFFTSLTHEFQTPAALLLATLRKLMDHRTDNVTASLYEIMHRNVMRILMLTDQQLDLRKIDNGQLHLRMQSIELQQFLIDQMQYYRDLATTMQVNFTLDMPDTSLVLWADPNELDKVVMNLLSNAFKFVNRQGQVIVSARTHANDGLLPEQKTSDVVQIEVFNSGSSVNESEAKRIFDRFYKGANTDDNGSGIGLNVAYELTQLQHGDLTVHNDEERGGVVFTIIMPLGDQHLTESERYIAPVAQEEPVAPQASELSPDPYENEQKSVKFDAEAERKMVQKYSLNIDYSQIKLESQDEKLLQRVLKVINKNLGDSSFCVETLSQEVGLSRVHLNRKLQDMLDISPSNLIKNIRLRQATYLLVQNNVSVSEVAYSVGFSSPSYFTSNFTQYFGMTPKEFIANYAAEPNDERLKELLHSAMKDGAGKPAELKSETNGSSSQA